jgi:alpha-glucosidase
MENVFVSWEETQDPAACANPEHFHEASRDPARTPFPWDDSLNAGFSNASKTWLPVGFNYKTVNVKAQLEASNSHLKIFKKLLQLRKLSVMRSDNFDSKLLNNDNIYTYKRSLNDDLVIVVLNLGKEKETVNLKSAFADLPEKMKIYTSSLESELVDGEHMDVSSISIKSDIGLVLVSSSSILKLNGIIFLGAIIIRLIFN